ncbi:hypothetical protein BKI52_06905 [marine bacterium AO1-C]|nr:hypothetical protein BKI52_06905 [marine bacterium AO1-C]
MNTKERIINTALKLFNQNGVVKTTTRKIAEEMGIRHGNLTYHYLKKEQMIEVLYDQMFNEMEERVQVPSKVSLQFIQNLLNFSYQFQYRYRFFFLDIVEITRLYPDIAQRHLHTQKKRVTETRGLLQMCVKESLLTPEKVPGSYDQIAQMIWFINTFWMSQQWVFGQTPTPKDAQATLHMIWQLLMPYFTEKGWTAYKSLAQKTFTEPFNTQTNENN